MGGGGQSSGGTTVQKSDPWDQQKPYLTYGFEQAQQQYNSNTPQYYQGNTVAPQSDTTKNAMNLQEQRALNGNPLANAGQQQLIDTVNGKYMNSNPMLDANFKAGASAITDAYDNAVRGQTAGFAGGNRTGSGMQAFMQNQQNDTLAKNLGNLYTNTYYNNYNTERQNQMNATQLAPTYANMDYTNLDALSNVGSAKDQYAQANIDANIDKWNYNQNLPANKLNQYMSLIQGNYGGTSSTATPKSGSNMMGNILSGAGIAASIFSDRRLKTDIVAIGKADNGLTIYSYKYIGGTKTHIGFMADEVEAVNPKAVSTNEDGYKMVNYELASRNGV